MDEVTFLRRLVEIYSPSGQEGEAIDYLRQVMAEHGFNVRVDGWGNVWGTVGSGEPRILLCGHVDTVPGRIPVRIQGNALYGRGAVDAKAPMAAMLMAGLRFSKAGLPGTLIVTGLVGEEALGLGGRAGIHGVLEQNPRVDYVIFGEPTGLNRITIAYRGRVGLRVICRSQESHAGSPSPSNSIEGMIEALRHLQAYAKAMRKLGDEFNSLALTPTLIQGGSFHNVVPGRCEAFLDIRVPPHLRNEDVVRKVQMILLGLSDSNRAFEVEVVDSTPPYEGPKATPLVRALVRAILTQTKLKPILTRKTGTGDMNVLGLSLRVPVATYGPGEATLSHTPHEHIDIDEYLTSISVYLQALTYLSKTHRRAG